MKKIVKLFSFFLIVHCSMLAVIITEEEVKKYLKNTDPFLIERYIYHGGDIAVMLAEEICIIEALSNNQVLQGGKTPLQIAVEMKNQTWLNFLLSLKIKAYQEIRDFGQKIYFLVYPYKKGFGSQKRSEKSFKDLSLYKNLVNQPFDSNGETVLMLAVRGNYSSLEEALIQMGADQKQQNIHGKDADMIREEIKRAWKDCREEMNQVKIVMKKLSKFRKF